MLWSGYLVGCGRYSKQERALSGSRGSSRSFSVRAGAVRIAAEPENVRQPHVLLEIHGGGEGGELDPCAGITALTAKREQISPRAARRCLPSPSLPCCPPCLRLPGCTAPCEERGARAGLGVPARRLAPALGAALLGAGWGRRAAACPAEAPGAFSRPHHPDLGVPQGPRPQALPGATAPGEAPRAAPSQLKIHFLTLSEPNTLMSGICSFFGDARLAGP